MLMTQLCCYYIRMLKTEIHWCKEMSKIMLVLLIVLLGPSVIHGCTSRSLRLYNPNNYSDGDESTVEGAVQICFNNRWRLLCNIGWLCEESNVVCRQLGYHYGAVASIYNAYPLYMSLYYQQSVSYDNWYAYYCNGNENSLSSCSTFLISFSCMPFEDVAAVRCLNNNSSESCGFDGQVRLVGSDSSSEGIPQYCYNNRWNWLCNNYDIEEAVVTCKSLGYLPFAEFIPDSHMDDNQNYVYSLISDISCSSSASESTLSSCSISIVSNRSCLTNCSSPSRIRCYQSSGCIDGSVRLVNGLLQERYIEICNNGIWGTICSNGWDKSDASVVCRQLGFTNSEPNITSITASDGLILYSNFGCHGWESSLSSCTKSSYPSFRCTSNTIAGVICADVTFSVTYDDENVAAVRCLNNNSSESCDSNGQVRLVGSDSTSEGIPQYCYNNRWNWLCNNYDIEEAVVMCKTLGYLPFAEFIPDSHVDGNQNYVYSLISDISCSSSASESTLSSCSISIVSNRSCLTNCSSPSRIRCYQSSGCIDGSVRLVNGLLQERYIEICNNGIWGTICSNGWDKSEALVVCRQLGFTNSEPNITSITASDGLILYSNFGCHGWESSLSSCTKSSYPSFRCTNNTIAGVICTDGVVEITGKLIPGLVVTVCIALIIIVGAFCIGSIIYCMRKRGKSNIMSNTRYAHFATTGDDIKTFPSNKS